MQIHLLEVLFRGSPPCRKGEEIAELGDILGSAQGIMIRNDGDIRTVIRNKQLPAII